MVVPRFKLLWVLFDFMVLYITFYRMKWGLGICFLGDELDDVDFLKVTLH